MDLLFLAHRVPYPPDRGNKIRAFQHLQGFAERGHTVHLLAFAHDAQERRAGPALADLCVSATLVPLDRRRAQLRALGSLVGRRPLSVGYFDSGAMRRLVRDRLARGEPAAAFVSCSTMAQYVPRELVGRTVVDLADADSEKWRTYARRMRPPLAWLYAVEGRRLRRYEHRILERFAYTVLTTAQEAAVLAPPSGRTPGRRPVTINTGVDLEYFTFTPDGSDDLIGRLPPSERGRLVDPSVARLVFVGALDYYPNLDGVRFFAEQVFPLIRRRRPRTELLIVGKAPGPDARRLGRRPGVTVIGSVEDVRPYLQAATVCLAPLRVVRGVQNKILVAMAAGRPVVATPEAAAGLGAIDGQHLLVGRTADEQARAVLRLLEDDQLRRALGARARRFVEAEHDQRLRVEELVRLVESVGGSERLAEESVALTPTLSQGERGFEALSPTFSQGERERLP